MTAAVSASPYWDKLVAHVAACDWCKLGGGLDGPPEGLCAAGRRLEREFDLSRNVRAPWEWEKA